MSRSKRNKPRGIPLEDDENEEKMKGTFGPTVSSRSPPPKTLYALSAQRNHVNQMVQEAKSIASNISMLRDTPTRTTIHRPSYSLPMQHHTNSEIRRDQLDNDSITVSSDDKSKLLNEHIKDVHFAYKVEIARYKKEIRELKEKDNNNASKKKSKIDLANEQFQHEQHVAKLRNQWMAAEEIARNDFRNKLMNEYREKERQLQNRMDEKFKMLKKQWEQASVEQNRINFETSEIKRKNAVRNALREERHKVRAYFRNSMNELMQELKDLYIVSKRQQASLQVLNEWKTGMLEKLKGLSKTFNQLSNDIRIIKRRHPQNLILLEKKYSAELENLSDELQSKIEEYSSAKKEKDQEYFLRKKIERRMNERHGSNNSAQYVNFANRTSPLSPTAFGCD